jgi:hypothetical protein
MNNIVWLESIRTEKGQIDTKNAKLPQVESYAEFWNILTNQKREAIYTKVDSLSDITIIPDISNNPDSPQTNKYAIQKEQKTTNGNVQVQLCYVVGKAKIENFLSQYIRHDIKQYKEIVQIQINETAEKTETILASQQELNTLVNEITEYDYTPDGIKEYFKNANALHKDIQKDYDASLRLIKDRQKNRQKPTVLEKNMLKLLEHKHTKDTRNITQLERTIKNLTKEYKKETNVDMRKQNSKETYLQLLYYRSQGQKLSGILHNESAQKNFVDNPDIYMDIPVESSQDAALLKNVYDAMSKERFRINELLTDANFKNIKDKNGQTMQEYLNATLEDGATAKQPFVPSSEYQNEYNEVLKNYPQLHEWMKKDPTDTRTNTSTTNTGNTSTTTQEIYNNPKDIEQYNRNKPKWLLDAVTLWPLTEFIDNRDRNPDQKKAAKTVAGVVSLAAIVGIGLMTVKKIWKWLFSKDKLDEKDWGWLLWWAWLFGTTMIVSWWNPLDMKSLWNGIRSLFWSNPENLASNQPNASAETLMADWMNTMNLIFGWMKWDQINSLLIETHGWTKIDYDKAKTFMKVNKSNITNADQRIKVIETLEKSPNQNIIDLWVQTLWLTKDKLAENPDKKYDELVEKWLTKFFNIVDFMDKNNYSRRNPDMTEYIYAYMRGESWRTTEKLEKVWAFEKNEILKENDWLKTNIEGLTLLNDDQKNDLYHQSLKVFKELQDQTEYKWELKFIEKNNKLYLQSYNQQTEINRTNKKLGNIPLYTSYQLLKAANLTNRLQDIFQGKADTDKPFNISAVRRNIEFQKQGPTSIQWWENPRQFAKEKFDTKALKAWRRGTLQEIAPSLEDNKQTYVDYLNTLPWRKKATA